MTLRYGLQEFAKNAELSECRFHASDGIPFVMPDDGDVERLLPPPAQTAPLAANTYASFKDKAEHRYRSMHRSTCTYPDLDL